MPGRSRGREGAAPTLPYLQRLVRFGISRHNLGTVTRTEPPGNGSWKSERQVQSVSGRGWGDRSPSQVTRVGTAPCRGTREALPPSPHHPVQRPESKGILVGLSLCRGRRGHWVTPSSPAATLGAAWTHLIRGPVVIWLSRPQGPSHEHQHQAGAVAALALSWTVAPGQRVGRRAQGSTCAAAESLPGRPHLS